MVETNVLSGAADGLLSDGRCVAANHPAGVEEDGCPWAYRGVGAALMVRAECRQEVLSFELLESLSCYLCREGKLPQRHWQAVRAQAAQLR